MGLMELSPKAQADGGVHAEAGAVLGSRQGRPPCRQLREVEAAAWPPGELLSLSGSQLPLFLE